MHLAKIPIVPHVILCAIFLMTETTTPLKEPINKVEIHFTSLEMMDMFCLNLLDILVVYFNWIISSNIVFCVREF
jgi:hypothetical protein